MEETNLLQDPVFSEIEVTKSVEDQEEDKDILDNDQDEESEDEEKLDDSGVEGGDMEDEESDDDLKEKKYQVLTFFLP